MNKKILIVGNGAKEYALAKKLSENNEVHITSTSSMLKEFAQCVDIREINTAELLEYVLENGIDMTIVTSVDAINADISSLFASNKQMIFAPSADSAKDITSKVQAKKLMYKLRIPTPKFGIFEKENMAFDYIKNQKAPFVIKTEQKNSAIVLNSYTAAKNIINNIFIEKNVKVIIEDYLYGTPFSYYAITDGYKALPLGSSITYKHKLEGDGGQLTSGMGACVPNYKLSTEQEYFVMDNIIYPTLEYLERQQNSYLGILGINGIITDDGMIQVLGWQTFMQDCDAASILDVLDEDLYKLFESCIIGSFSDEINVINTRDKYSVSLTLCSKSKGLQQNVISGLDNVDDDVKIIFYPKVTRNKYLETEACEGPVLILSSAAATISKASKSVYAEAESIDFSGKYYRKDICRIKY